jgi:hypothetical protein
MIGTRPSSAAAGSEGPARSDLLEALGGSGDSALVLRLDREPAAAHDYTKHNVRKVLERHPVGSSALHSRITRRVAKMVELNVRNGTWQFLQASLVVQEIQQNPGLLAQDAAGKASLEELLARDQTGLFRAAVARIVEGLPSAWPLLQALAYGLGRGLPRADGIWVRAAAGIAAEGGRLGAPWPNDTVIDEKLLSLFLSRAAAYVMLDGEDRRSVYRLAHHTYAEQLLRQDAPQYRFAMFRSLLLLAAEQAGAGQPLSPHLAARLADYAADCGVRGWRELAKQRRVVDRLPIAALSARVLAPQPGEDASPSDLPVEISGTISSAHLIEESEQDDRPGLRQLGGLRSSGDLQEAGAGAAWKICWGRLRHDPLHLQLGVGGTAALSALLARPSSSWLVTGAFDGSVVVWSPWREHQPVMLLQDRHSVVTALAASGPPGTEGEETTPGLLAIAYDDKTLQLWDTDLAQSSPVTTGSTEIVTAMVAVPDGSGAFAIAGMNGYLAMLGPDGNRPSAAEVFDSSEVVGLVCITDAGRQLVVTAHQAGYLAVWHVIDGSLALLIRKPVGHLLAGLTCVTTVDGSQQIVTATEGGAIARWRLSTTNGGLLIVTDLPRELPNTLEDTGLVLAALPMPEGGTALVVGAAKGTLTTIGPQGDARCLVNAGGLAATAISVMGGPRGGSVLVTLSSRSPRVHFWDPLASVHDDGPAETAHEVVDLRRHLLPGGREALIVTNRISGGGRERRIFSAGNGDQILTSEIEEDLLPEHTRAKRLEAAPQAAAAYHQFRLVDSTVLIEASPQMPSKQFVVTADRAGDVVLWGKDRHGREEPLRRIRLGAPCRSVAALSDGRLAVATDDGIVVLKFESVGSGEGPGNEESHD